MKLRTIIAKAITEYPIYIGEQLLERADFKKNNLVMIMDSQVAKVYKTQFETLLQFNLQACLIVPAGESSKTREMKQALEDELLAKNLGRDIIILAVGGGMICDLAGFLAATYCRGVPVIYWPTSLMAMVDASIGGKTAVNTPFGKNLIGAFTTPYAVWMDIDFLKSLKKGEFYNGMVEVIKHAVIADPNFFKKLIKNHQSILGFHSEEILEMISHSCKIKNDIVIRDAQDVGVRSTLNFGHTIGHAIEHYENYHLKHGQAVAIGMLVETYIAYLKGYTEKKLIEDLQAIFKLYHIQLKTQAFHHPDELIDILYRDKKNQAKKIHMVLIKQIGEVVIDNDCYTQPIEESEIIQAMEWARDAF